jgi:hypothetical protein
MDGQPCGLVIFHGKNHLIGFNTDFTGEEQNELYKTLIDYITYTKIN